MDEITHLKNMNNYDSHQNSKHFIFNHLRDLLFWMRSSLISDTT